MPEPYREIAETNWWITNPFPETVASAKSRLRRYESHFGSYQQLVKYPSPAAAYQCEDRISSKSGLGLALDNDTWLMSSRRIRDLGCGRRRGGWVRPAQAAAG